MVYSILLPKDYRRGAPLRLRDWAAAVGRPYEFYLPLNRFFLMP
jgi:hypothetical protein